MGNVHKVDVIRIVYIKCTLTYTLSRVAVHLFRNLQY